MRESFFRFLRVGVYIANAVARDVVGTRRHLAHYTWMDLTFF